MEDGFPLAETLCGLFEWIARSSEGRRTPLVIRFDTAMAACGIADEEDFLVALNRLRDCPGLGARVVVGIRDDQGQRCFLAHPEASEAWEAYCRHVHATVCPTCRVQSLRTVTKLRCARCGYERPVEPPDRS